MSDGAATVEETGEVRTSTPWWRDWRILITVAITGVAFWFAVRGIPLDQVLVAVKGADLVILIGLSVPAYLASVYFRGLRWRHLTNPIAPLDRGLLARGVSIGFMVNNLVPLRVGEVVRAWYVGREGGVSASSIFGTVVLERVIDLTSVILLAAGALAFAGSSGGGSSVLSQGALLMVPIALVPLLGLICLRLIPDVVIQVVSWLLRPFPDRVASSLEVALRNFTKGLGALSGGSHLFWIAFHSAVIWILCSMLPMLAGLLAFGVDLGSGWNLLLVSYVVLGAVAVAVAIPAAPGFFGTYQLAFKTTLESFGVDGPTALALGLIVWFVFWITMTLLGFVVMRVSGTRLADLTRHASEPDA